SGVKFLRFLRAMNSSWRIFAPFGVSTEAGEDQTTGASVASTDAHVITTDGGVTDNQCWRHG
ncbi:MAG TPA: hypothetical protein VK762_12215, partial [Polyangiaceae bacterium]|nr:hypothetical protein [Polyangiaceae bacterium]